MARFAKAILNRGELDGRRILSAASVETMLTEHQVPRQGSSPELSSTGNDNVRHGLTWFVVRDGDRLYYEHGGGGPGWAALMRISPGERLAIVLTSNGTVLPAAELADAIAKTAW